MSYYGDINMPAGTSINTEGSINAKQLNISDGIFNIDGVSNIGGTLNVAGTTNIVGTTNIATDINIGGSTVVRGQIVVDGMATFNQGIIGVTKNMVGLTNVSNLAPADLPVSNAAQTAMSLLAPLNNPTFTGTVNGITSNMVGLGNVTNTTSANLPISNAAQAAMSLLAPLNNPTFTGTVNGITSTMIGLGNVTNTTSANLPISNATQTALNLLAPILNPAFTGIATVPTAQANNSSLQIANTAFVSTAIGNLISSSPSTLDTLNEITQAINNDPYFYSTITTLVSTKAPIESPAFTGTVTGINSTMVGLGNVANTSPANLPISNATQTALNLLAPLAGAVFTGPVSFATTVSGITKDMIGLDNVANTAPSDLPVSNATQYAISMLAPLANPTFIGTVGGISKGMVGLFNVDNTSDVNKPISYDVKNALLLKADKDLGFANIYCKTNVPSAANTNEYVNFDTIDTVEWTISPSNPTELICQKAGVWNFKAMYNMINVASGSISADEAMITGWIEINNSIPPNVTAYGSVVSINGRNVLVVTYSQNIFLNDRIKVGIKAGSSNVKCMGFNDYTNIDQPSIILTATYVTNYTNIVALSNLPTVSNTNSYVKLDTIDNTNWIINPADSNDTEILCNYSGTWEFTVEYQMVNLLATDLSDNTLTQVTGWLELNGSVLPNTCVVGYNPSAGSKNRFTISYASSFNLNDSVKFGIRSNTSNVICPQVNICANYINSYVNVVSLNNAPVAENTNEYIVLDMIDTENWTINSNTPTQLICNVAGSWKFTIQYHIVNINNVDSNGAFVSGFANLNGEDIRINNASISAEKIGGRSVLTLSFNEIFKIGDTIKIGVRSSSNILNAMCQGYYDDNTLLYSPPVVITLTSMSQPIDTTLPISGYSNPYSISSFPSTVNSSEYISISYIDTGDWTINQYDSSELICVNEGSWEFVVKYMMVNISNADTNDNIMGWVNMNGVDIVDTGAFGYVSATETNNILYITYSNYFVANDKIKFGSRSNNSNDSTLNIYCNSSNTDTGDNIPSAIITATKVATYANMFSSLATPVNINTTEYVPLKISSLDNTSDWKVNTTNETIWTLPQGDSYSNYGTVLECVVSGRWQFNVHYHLYNDVADTNSALFSGWIEKNGTPASVSNSYLYKMGSKNVLLVSYIETYIQGDLVRFGIRSNSTSVQCLDTTSNNINIHSVSIAASKIISYINLYNNSTLPLSNNFEYIPFTNINASDDWQLDTDNTNLVCSGTGTWKFTVQYHITNISNPGSLTGIMKINGNQQFLTETIRTVNILNEKDTMTITYVSNFKQSDTVSFGLKSTNMKCLPYTDSNTTFNVNAINLFASKLSVPLGTVDTDIFKPGFISFFSKTNAPSVANTTEYILLDANNSSEWFIGNTDKRELICNSDGVWSFTVKYQLTNISTTSAVNGEFRASINVNGTLAQTFISSNIIDYGGKNILIGTFSSYFSAGDVVKFSVYSYNSVNNNLNIQCQGYTDYSGIYTPSISFNAIKVNSADILLSNAIVPTAINTNEYIVFNSASSNNWTYNNTELTCSKTGVYQFIMQYMIKNTTADILAANSLITGWIERYNGSSYSIIDNTGSTGYAAKNGSENTIIVCYSGSFNMGDKIKFGIRGIGLANALYSICYGTRLSINSMVSYANIYSNNFEPYEPNTNEAISLYNTDTNDWSINFLDDSQLVCKNPGSWQFIVLYHMNNVSDNDLDGFNSQLASYILINGEPVDNSNVTGYVNNVNGKNVLTNIYVGNFAKDDLIQFGIITNSNDGNMNVQCKNYSDPSGAKSRAITISAAKYNDSINFQLAYDNNILPTTYYTILEPSFNMKQNIFSNIINAYSQNAILQNPVINTNYYINWSFIDTNEWVINSADKTELICMNSGTWQFMVEYMVTNTAISNLTGANSMVAGWLSYNNIVETPSYIDNSFPVPGRSSFILAYTKKCNQGDTIKFGIRTNNINVWCSEYNDTTGVRAPAIRLTANNPDTSFNVTSITNAPTRANTNEYIQLQSINSPYWIINPGNKTELICRLKTNWQFVVQYELINNSNTDLSIADSRVSGWIELSESASNSFDPITDSNSNTNVYIANSNKQLVFSTAYNFNVGDRLRFGIRSSSLNVQCKSVTDIFGAPAPSVMITAISVSEFSNIISNTDTPSIANTNEMIPLNLYDTNSWLINQNNNKILICQSTGAWQFVVTYHMANITNDVDSGDARISGYIYINGKQVYTSNSSSFIEKADGVNTMVLSFASNVMLGDTVEFGIRASTLNGSTSDPLNVQCIASTDLNSIDMNSVNITITKLSNYIISTNKEKLNEVTVVNDTRLLGNVGFFGTTPIKQQVIANMTDTSDSLANLYTILRNYGLIL